MSKIDLIFQKMFFFHEYWIRKTNLLWTMTNSFCKNWSNFCHIGNLNLKKKSNFSLYLAYICIPKVNASQPKPCLHYMTIKVDFRIGTLDFMSWRKCKLDGRLWLREEIFYGFLKPLDSSPWFLISFQAFLARVLTYNFFWIRIQKKDSPV